MSATNTPESDGYRRDDWWGENETDVETVADEHREHGTAWSTEEITNDKARSVAHKILRGAAPALCSVSVIDPAKKATELTEPEVYPPSGGNREHMRACRVNEEEGYISGGESTGVRLGDLPSDEFYDVIEILLAIWQKTAGITESGATILMRDARRMKQEPDITDEEAIKRLVEDVITPGAIGEDRVSN